MPLIAQLSSVPWPLAGNWFLGLVGVLGVAWLVLGVAHQSRRLFGKHPPLGEELARIDQELRRDLARVAKECEHRHEIIHNEMDERFRELAVERARSLGDLHEKINGVAADVAFIRGKIEK
jgi:hypothetical protein